jgi:hypothetical protein
METRTKRQVLIAIVAIVVVCLLSFILWGRGRRKVLLEGTLQWGFEQSAFFPSGDCSTTPFWWNANGTDQHDNDLNARWQALGKQGALRVKVIGNLSSVGMHGHLGLYRREIQPVQLISVGPAPRCQWLGGR